MHINWKVRIKNPMFWIGLIGAIGAPVLAYMGIAAADLKTWGDLWNVVVNTVSNPYLIGIVILAIFSFLGVANEPTTAGLSDSGQAMGYDEPRRG